MNVTLISTDDTDDQVALMSLGAAGFGRADAQILPFQYSNKLVSVKNTNCPTSGSGTVELRLAEVTVMIPGVAELIVLLMAAMLLSAVAVEAA